MTIYSSCLSLLEATDWGIDVSDERKSSEAKSKRNIVINLEK